ncbi:MAG: hypothetical protein H7840_15840 [Alphaproteobacteria bacterium]
MTMVVFLRKELREMIDWYLDIGVMPEEIVDAVREQMYRLDAGDSVAASSLPGTVRPVSRD